MGTQAGNSYLCKRAVTNVTVKVLKTINIPPKVSELNIGNGCFTFCPIDEIKMPIAIKLKPNKAVPSKEDRYIKKLTSVKEPKTISNKPKLFIAMSALILIL